MERSLAWKARPPLATGKVRVRLSAAR